MDDRTKIVPPASAVPMSKPAPGMARQANLRRRFPTVFYLREHARTRIPKFGFDATDGGAGRDGGIARNAAALDAIELMPRYGIDKGTCDMEIELFGKRYSAPIGIAPMGMPGIVWPGAEKYLAMAAKRARIPYTAGTVASSTVEELAELAEDMLWFQLYRMPQRDHADGFDLVRRAQAAGAQVLVITMDVPIRTKRPREVRRGLVLPFRDECAHGMGCGDVAGVADGLSGTRAAAVFQLQTLCRRRTDTAKTCRLQQQGSRRRRRILVGRSRRAIATSGKVRWSPRAFSIREDAIKAVSLGCDGIQVSNHGGRQIEGLPSSIDVLPAIVDAVGKRATIILNSGVRTGST